MTLTRGGDSPTEAWTGDGSTPKDVPVNKPLVVPVEIHLFSSPALSASVGKNLPFS